ncbi:MAG: chemotaxis response regulator protein-glutamate methylesterase [bacterium]|nr:chemotaxis response regulator protein-glutamate methylesterase [bacterium]
MKRIKVLVIDDSAFNRRTISDMLEKSSDIEVVGTANDGEEGLKKAFSLKPDVITLDLEMPKMDGFTFLRILMAKMPMPVIVVSSRDDDANVFKALEFGAVDFLAKPTARISKDLLNIEKDILSKVKVVSELKMDNLRKRIGDNRPTVAAPAKALLSDLQHMQRGDFDLLAIGSSTGGPPALQSIFTVLPKDLPLAIVVSQHMPPGFTRAFADRLNRLSNVAIKEAEEGDLIEKGRVLIAPGGAHMTFSRRKNEVIVNISPKRSEDMYAPSVDRMFSSAAKAFEGRSIGLVLTGMGSDGKKGVVDIKNSKGYIMAESEETAIVYGMPNEAVKTGMVDKILPLDQIAEEIINLCKRVD